MNLKSIGTSRVITVGRETSLNDAARLMRDHHVGDVVVVENREGRPCPVGILTDRDLVMATTALGAPTEPMAAGDVMTSEVVTAAEDAGLSHVIRLMKTHGVKRIPLVGLYGELVGLVALEDVMSFLVTELASLAAVGKEQELVEWERRRRLA